MVNGVSHITIPNAFTMSDSHSLLRFLMRRVLFAVPAKLFELEPVFERLFILVRKVGHTLTDGALELNQIILRHRFLAHG